LVPFIAALGLNETSVRLPSAIAGIVTVIGMGFLIRFFAELIWPEQKTQFFRGSQLLGMSVAAISAWLIQFSRGGWEVNLATSLLLWSVILGLFATRKSSRKVLQMIGCVVLAALSMYVYHATRVIAPGLVASLFIIWALPILTLKKNWSLSGFVQL